MTNKMLLSASVLALLLAAPAAAQQADRPVSAADKPAAEMRTDTKAGAPASEGATAATTAPTVQPPGTVDADKLIGRNIKNPQGETIGEVSSVLIGRDGRIEAVIVGVGGFLGIGQRDVAIDWDQLQIRDDGRTVVADMTKDQLRALPEFQYAEDVQRDREQAPMRDRTATGVTGSTPAERTAGVGDRAAPAPATGAQTRAETDAAPRAGSSGADVVVVPPPGAGTTAGTEATAQSGAQLGQMRADELIGKDVVNLRGETVGEIEDIVVDSNRAVHAIVSVGGFLGIGDKDVAVPFDTLRIGQDNAIMMSEADEDQLKQMPAWKKDDRWQSIDREQPVMGR